MLGFLGKALEIVGGALGIDIVKDVGRKVSEGDLSADQRAALEQAVLDHEAEMRRLLVEEAGIAASLVKAELASDDAYVKRARPTGMYIAYAAIIANYIVFPIAGVPNVLTMEILLVLMGYPAWYVWNRTQEKKAGVAR